jgi:hypothetical protein
VATDISPEYVSGQCNIGPSEIRKRRTVALLGLVLTGLGIASYIHLHSTHTARLGIFIPLLVFSVGFIQSRKKFCLAFGFMGTFNFGKSRDIARVSLPEDRARDRATALKILGEAVAIALVLTLVVVLLPL